MSDKINLDPAKTIDTGAVVKLRSGGPEMTVMKSNGDGSFSCGWFNRDDNYQTFVFHMSVLDVIWKWPGRPKVGDKP